MVRILILFILCFSPLSYAGKSRGKPTCPPIITTIVNNSHPDRYAVAEAEGENHRFFATAEIMGDGKNVLASPIPGKRTLALSITLKDKDGRSSVLRGKEEFKKILKHFEGRFDQIEGNWNKQGDELSDNLDEINRLTSGAHALSLKEAALKTWTGQQAAAAGYTQVHVEEMNGNQGQYSQVIVKFKKPN